MAKKKKRRKIEKIPVKDIKPGPIRHKQGLSPLLERTARDLFSRVGHFVYPSFEQWELGFMRDMQPWREVLIWEVIARAFDLYSAKHPDADGDRVVGVLSAISTGHVFENETEMDKELRELFLEAGKHRWSPFGEEPVEFPEGNAIVLLFEDIVDEWNGSIHPNLRRQHDPRPVLAQADIILGQDVKTDECFCLFGTDRLEDGGGIPAGLKTLVIGLNPEDEKAAEMEKICAVIQMIRGRHDCR
jgi:hypothetical protein